MSDSKFTPGPWVSHETGRARSGVPEHEIHWSADGECVAEVVHGTANAHLIAAAPELYEALWIATEHNRLHCGESHNTVIHGMAALKKARGES